MADPPFALVLALIGAPPGKTFHNNDMESLTDSLQEKEQAMIPEEVGKRAAYALLSQLHAGGCVDGLHQVCLKSLTKE